MIPKRVLLENFLSFGEATTIEFTADEPLWVLGGPNGVGKSAVFDAMTYCLFGCHRGGASDHASLVRHGANGFRVEFDFEFDGTDYRITRNRSGRTTQKVERHYPDTCEWRPVAGVNSVAEVNAWSVRTLGVEFEAFKASVLLRQGEADAIITAGGTERLRILKKIIDAERFEALSKKIHESTRKCKDRLETLQEQRDTLPWVTTEALNAARFALEQAETARSKAHEVLATASDRIASAKRWVELDKKLQAVEKQTRDANARAEHEQRIRTNKARFDDLSAAVPVLRSIVSLRASLANAEVALCDRRAEAKRVAAALKAQELQNEIRRDSDFIKAADELAAFPTDLDKQVSAANELARTCGVAFTSTVVARAEVDGLRKQAKARQKEFDLVGAGVKCSRCGQEVTEEHAQRERDDISAEVNDLENRYADAATAERKAEISKNDADNDHIAKSSRQQDQRTASTNLARLQQVLTQSRSTTNTNELRQALAAKVLEAKGFEAAAADQANVGRPTLERRQTEINRKLNGEIELIAKDKGTVDARIGQLSINWRANLETIDAGAVQSLDDERQTLESANVAKQFEFLQQDAALRNEWIRQSTEYATEIAAIPELSRVPIADAEHDASLARNAASEADTARDAAKTSGDNLDRHAAEFKKVKDDIAVAERQHDLHKKLDDALGKDGLQRELVRTAEREIVRHANDTVRNLSDGDLSIELDKPDGADEVFALKVRQANDPTPIGVNYLSGSQKFRVAVSVALAIGRFAAGHSRRLESVIIDEGFGSLDRDGLAAMADELNRLKQYLRRIILVSHQDEFADRFPVVIKLSHGENGTIVEPFRR